MNMGEYHHHLSSFRDSITANTNYFVVKTYIEFKFCETKTQIFQKSPLMDNNFSFLIFYLKIIYSEYNVKLYYICITVF